MKKIFFAIFIIFLSISLYANDQRIIPLTSDVYDLIDSLSLETRLGMLSKERPYSEAQILSILNQIDKSKLSDAGVRAVAEIEKIMEKDPLYEEGKFSGDISGEIAIEGYLHTSDDESQWQYNYNDRKAILTLTFETWLNENFYAVIEPDLREDRFVITDTDDNGNYEGNYTNIPSSFGDLNYHFPTRGFFSFGSENWNIQIGRDRLEYGNGETGKLLLSSYPDFYDFIKAKCFVKNFAYTYSLIDLESWTDDDENLRFISDHALSVRLFEDMLTLSVNESALFYGEIPTIQYVSPLIIYHNLIRNHQIGDSIVNICMTLGANFAPVKGLSFYGEYLLDEISTLLEQEEYGEDATVTPNAFAFLAGSKLSYPAGPGYISGFLEFVYTSPWCYLLSPEGGSMIWSHRDANDVTNSRENVKKYLGYEYGPDSMGFGMDAVYMMPTVFKAGLSADFIIKGENDYDSEYAETVENAFMTTPTGTPEYRLILGLFGSYQLFDFLSFEIDTAWLRINNYNHVESSLFYDFQTAFSVVFDFSKKVF
ncbi:MAG: hypothetical protein PQJ46_11215 [Spirochaetales bacterium]|nr:hypothetical protein [Spirochaetales bacterium]